MNLTEFFNSCPGLTAEDRATIQDSTDAIAELIAENEQMAIDGEVESILSL